MSPISRVPPLQSLVAGMVEVLGLLMLGGLFTAHVTGNIVVVAALLVRGGAPTTPQVLALPTYVGAVGVVWLVSKCFRMSGQALLRPLLLVECVLLAGVWLLALWGDVERDPSTGIASLVAVLATSAMACQFAMMRIAVPGAPSTAVMTGNLTYTVLAGLDLLTPRRLLVPQDVERLRKTAAIVVVFCVGAVMGGLAFVLMRAWAWSLPVTVCVVTLLLVSNLATVRLPSRGNLLRAKHPD